MAQTGRLMRFVIGAVLILIGFGLMPMMNQLFSGAEDTFTAFIVPFIPIIIGIVFLISSFVVGKNG